MNCGFATYGVSDSARFVDDAAARNRQSLHSLHTFGNKRLVLEELWTVWKDCSAPDWDGYGAEAVDVEVYRNAYRFIEALPLGCALPTIGADPQGALTLEWYKSPRRVLSISVSASGELHFAGVFGPGSRHCGTEDFFSELPESVIQMINKVSPL